MYRLKDSWGKAKILLSQLLCIGAMFTACTDDDTIVQSDKAPLQISVSSKAPAVSRTIIDGSSLPDGIHISVSVFDADGGDYDGQDYFNLKYTAAGEGEGQSWGTATPASLSTTMAVVAAYFPYIDNDDLDLTAVPVETASQTDYMYSGAVAGANMSSPEVTLNMSHALANIHVNIKKGAYTGIGEVSQMAVKAAAFATTATMNVFDGTLDNIDGKGAEFTQKITDAAISAGMVEQDFLIVPDGSSESGNISLSVTVDGKKFTAGIDYDEAFQQGYTYTYNLTLNNEDLKVEAVEVLPWGEKASFDERLDLYDDEYIVEIAVPNDNYSYRHNVGNFVGTIDWGDGTTTEYISPTGPSNVPIHTYVTAGTYTIIAEGKMVAVNSNNVQRIITKLVRIGKDMGVTNMDRAFVSQTLLAEIVPGALDGCTEVTSFYMAFSECSSLQAIPEGLFDKCTKVKDFGGLFLADYTATNRLTTAMNLKVIPVGLFDKCTEVTNFGDTFKGCNAITSIPEGLFDNNTKVTNFDETFRGCSSLTSIPKGLFDKCPEVTRFRGTFQECNNIITIPKGLFDYNTKVTDFGGIYGSYVGGTFDGCTKLTTIPEGLFDNCTKVTSFYDTFSGCSSLVVIPEGLFDHCTEVTNYNATFYGCKSLKEIPSGLFDSCTKITKYNQTFTLCYALTAIPEGLFDKCTEVTNFESTFSECINLKIIPENLFKYNTKTTTFNGSGANGGCFYKCTSLTNIPEGLFKYNTEVTSFNGVFRDCKNIIEIPEGLFKYNTKVTNFGGTFYGCTGLTTIPEKLFEFNVLTSSFGSTFAECTKLQAIPTGLFDKCTEVTNFSNLFRKCGALKNVPVGLFDNNTKVMNFEHVFSGYYSDYGRDAYVQMSIIGESPYTVINVDGQDVKVHLYERANYPEHFTAPTNYNRGFYYCSKLDDYSSIPSDWK